MEKNFQRGYKAVRSPAIDELTGAARHRLAFERIVEQILHRLAKLQRANLFMPAETGAGAFFFQALDVCPMPFGLDNHQLRDAHAGQFERQAAAAGYGEMAAADP